MMIEFGFTLSAILIISSNAEFDTECYVLCFTIKLNLI